MNIGSTNDISSYLARLYQQTQSTSTSSTTYSNSSLLQNLAYSDTVEISEDAYYSLASGNDSAMKPPPPPMDGAGEALESLVDEGTISSDQASAIKDAIINAVDEASSDSSDLSNQAASSTTNPLKSLLDDLVSDGTLSEDQAASVADALKPPPPPPPQSDMTGSEDSATANTETDDDTDNIDTILNGLLKYGSSTKEYVGTLIGSLSADGDEATLQSLYDNLKIKSVLTSDQLSDMEALLTSSSDESSGAESI